jgi:hypothetical protein
MMEDEGMYQEVQIKLDMSVMLNARYEAEEYAEYIKRIPSVVEDFLMSLKEKDGVSVYQETDYQDKPVGKGAYCLNSLVFLEERQIYDLK